MSDDPMPRPLIGHLPGPADGRADAVAEVDLRVADLMARHCGLTDPVALDLVVLLVAAQRQGHSCLDLGLIDELLGDLSADEPTTGPEIPRLEDLIGVFTGHPAVAETDVQRALETVSGGPTSDDQVRPLVLDGSKLFSQRNHTDETSVAYHLRRLAAAPPAVLTVVDDVTLDGLFDGPVDDPVDPQRRAVRKFLEGGVTVITGGPGTGKTFTIARALAALIGAYPADRPPRIAVSAPTGKAAAQTKESMSSAATGIEPALAQRLVDIEPTTIHRLLGSHPDSRTRFRHDAHHTLGVDVVVVDETSMMSLALLARLLEAVPSGARLLLVGDPDQLESIESGSTLRDIVEADSPASPLGGRVVRLLANHRARGSTQIGELAEAIRLGSTDTVLNLMENGTGITWIPTDHPPDHARLLLDPVLPSLTDVDWSVADEEDLQSVGRRMAALTAHRLLCGNRHGPGGASTWNRLIESALGVRGAWYPGRPLLVTHNESRMGLVNGDVGVTVRTPDGLRACFEVRGSLKLLHHAQLPPVETAYALTIHKSQGSEYTDVTAILPSTGSPLLRRELLYTAITRARRSVTIVATSAAIRSAVERRSARMTDLVNALTRP